MSLFFGNEDVKVSIIGRESYSLGKLDKILIATNEADIPAAVLSGRDAKEELKRALQAYKGTILMVSHEPEFYQDIATDIINCEDWTTKVV